MATFSAAAALGSRRLSSIPKVNVANIKNVLNNVSTTYASPVAYYRRCFSHGNIAYYIRLPNTASFTTNTTTATTAAVTSRTFMQSSARVAAGVSSSSSFSMGVGSRAFGQIVNHGPIVNHAFCQGGEYAAALFSGRMSRLFHSAITSFKDNKDDDAGDDDGDLNKKSDSKGKAVNFDNEEGEGEVDGEAEAEAEDEGKDKKRTRRRRTKNSNSSDTTSTSAHTVPDYMSNLPQSKINSDDGLAAKTVPAEYPEVLVLPMERSPVFPRFIKVVEIKDSSLIRRIKHNIQIGRPYLGAFLKKDDNNESDTVKSLEEVYDVGTFVHVQETADIPAEGRLRMLLMGHRRILAEGALEGADPLTAKVINVVDKKYDKNDSTIKALSGEIIKTIRDIVKLNPLYRETIHQILDMSHKVLQDPSHLADFGAAFTSADAAMLQDVLDEVDIEQRLSKSLNLLKQEHLQAKLQTQIRVEVEDKINKSRRKHLLEEQLKIIKRELGLTKDDKESVVEKFKERMKDLKMSEQVQKTIDEEIQKLQFLDANSSEFNVTRNYLDWLTLVPWGKLSDESLDVVKAQGILDEDHFGMKDVKERILEFIAVGSLVGTVQGKILCFVGPPGVGKTSIAKSIARALQREYYRFSVGGLHDVAEIKGHRRTYVGAMPGKMVQCLKKVQCENPLVLIDEIDKIGRGGHNGDPTSALLELLDPEQNSNFLDHYLDVPIDMSKVLFICTANTLDTIPAPLLDRMEVIELSGYVSEEKIAIAEQYLIPEAREKSGLDSDKITVKPEAIKKMIELYCRESGVRNLEKHIEKLYRKAALEVVRENKDNIVIDAENLSKYIGSPRFTSDRLYENTPPGVVTGLAWTSMGGSVLYIETVASRVKGKDADDHHSAHFAVTGSLGDVMKESTKIALTYAKQYVYDNYPDNTFFRTADINLHVPEGATPKDGPSAGVTIVTALISLATGQPVRKDLAMTGEISLTGKVLRVGGIKEKVLAAKRNGIKHVILPALCESDYKELPDFVRADIDVTFAKTYEDVYKVAFTDA